MTREYSDIQETKYVPRYTPSTDDDWASGVETLGLDNATVQELINQVNKESYHWNTAGMRKPEATKFLGVSSLMCPLALPSPSNSRIVHVYFT